MFNEFLKEYEDILYKCERPSRYIGGEFLSFHKDFNLADVKMLFAFPDKYEIGISNFGHKILYNIINKTENFLADRVYAPEPDFRDLLKERKKLLYGLDSKRPAISFDFVGFALQYELSYTTILSMLDMSDIPILNKERKDGDPIILAGGPCVFNPNPIADFIDLFLIGDGEDTVLEICEVYNKIKNLKRSDIIKRLAEIEGVYSPLYSDKVKKRISKLTYENHPTISPIPHFASVQDRATIEIRRGCSRLCRFCQSAHTNLPVRERKKEDIIKLAKEYVKNTGYDEYSLLSLSSNDHPDIEEILRELNAHFKNKGVSVSLPSQRADNFSLSLAELMSEGKKSTITLAPEAGSQRMRDVINKNLTENQIISAILACVKNGWNKVKLYFMIGLPYETYDDLDKMIELLSKVNQTCRENGLKLPQITCSTSIFVPKPFTPFQWCPQNSIEEMRNKMYYLKDKGAFLKNVKINVHNMKLSQIEAFLTRGDKRLNEFIYKLYKTGSYLESWDENLDFDKYISIATECGLNIEDLATKEYSLDETLPWDFIQCIDKKYLRDGYLKARSLS